MSVSTKVTSIVALRNPSSSINMASDQCYGGRRFDSFLGLFSLDSCPFARRQATSFLSFPRARYTLYISSCNPEECCNALPKRTPSWHHTHTLFVKQVCLFLVEVWRRG